MQRFITLCIILLAAVAVSLMAQPWPSAKLTVPPSDIIFSHSLHVTDMEMDCATCHVEIESSTSSDDRNFPTMDECSACHDVESEDNCGMCHRNPEEPEASPHPDRDILFNHEVHLEDGLSCEKCHDDIAKAEESSDAYMPDKPLCMSCHDGKTASEDCAICHGDRISLADIHPAEWPHQHGEFVVAQESWCATCHQTTNFCIDCHRGDNLTGNIHDLNYIFTHGLDVENKRHDCAVCHDKATFCTDCHNSASRMPLNHSRAGWTTGHGVIAQRDIENCAACHDNADPTCARAGCHSDYDGLRGTNPPIHRLSGGQLDGHGPWHDDDRYYCFQCHTNTRVAGRGFCGYCHGGED